MPEYCEKPCPQCGQKLRFPTNVGGIVMRCPSCGKEFHSDFKVGSSINKRQHQEGTVAKIFGMPMAVLKNISHFLHKK